MSDFINNHFSTISEKLTAPLPHLELSLDKLIQFCNGKFNGQQCDTHIPFLTIFDTLDYIKDLKNSNSCGADGISSRALKLSAPYIYESLTYIFNLGIEKAVFPDVFKVAKVFPIHKSADTNEVNNFRPISLLSSLTKLLERHLHKHLSHHLRRYDLLHPNQSGFRQSHSCETALLKLAETWLSSIRDENDI